jgi:splicing factor 1
MVVLDPSASFQEQQDAILARLGQAPLAYYQQVGPDQLHQQAHPATTTTPTTTTTTTTPSETRQSRWGDYAESRTAPRRSRVRHFPTSLPSTLAPEQMDAYVMCFRLDEVARRLRNNDYIPKPQDRSPSPPPEYGSDGKRTNTLDLRYRRKAEEELHRLCTWGQRNLPGFRAPPEYRRPTKFGEKLMVPVHDYPSINFIGLLIGPRGNTLKKMEADSGARISIRGKGAVKEGKTRQDGLPAPGADEDLHCWVSADSEEKIKKAILIIQHIIETAKTVPEAQNQLKQLQLRELASLNGTLRDDIFQNPNNLCNNCGAPGHRRFECPEAKNFVNAIICHICGGAGHIARGGFGGGVHAFMYLLDVDML